jgi:iron complex outermembrane recepter protein
VRAFSRYHAGVSVSSLGIALVAGSLLTLAFGGSTAFAQEATGGQTDSGEIVVTAQKRAQNIQDVPLAVSALSGEQLGKLGINNAPDVTTQVPSFRVTYERGPTSIPNFSIRGVRGAALASRFNESSVALYVDEVFIGDETSFNSALFDVERVEVLRGPQGTVFGKNTTAGLVHFISAKPTDTLSAYGNVGTGSDNQALVEGAISGPLSDRIRVRLAGKMDRDDGHYRNRHDLAGIGGVEKKNGDLDVWGLRGTIDVDLTEKTLFRFIGAYSQNNSENAPGITYGMLLPGTTGSPPYPASAFCSRERILHQADCISVNQAATGAEPNIGRESSSGGTNLLPDQLKIRGRNTSLTGLLRQDLDWGTLTSIANYTRNFYSSLTDSDALATPQAATGGLNFNYNNIYVNKSWQFSEELRLNGSTSAFDWVVGGLYYTDRKQSFSDLWTISSANNQLMTFGRLKSTSFAMFGQLDAHLSRKFTLSIGGRYTNEKRELLEAITFAKQRAAGIYTNLDAALADTAAPFTAPLQDVRGGLVAAGQPTSTLNKDFTGKLSLTYEPNSNNTFYLSYSRGVKGAGFSSGFSPTNTLAQNMALVGPVGQETLDSYEIGAKNRFFGRKLGINTAAFYYDFRNKQEQIFLFSPATQTLLQNYLNAGDAEVYGIETEIDFRPSSRWNFNFNGSLLRGKITKSDKIVADGFGRLVPLQGVKLANLPSWSFSSYLSYTQPIAGVGDFTIQPEVQGVARVNESLTQDPLAADDPHVFVNLRLFWESESRKFNAQVFVTNLFNELSLINTRDLVFRSGKYNTTEGLGRLWGVKLGVKF